MKTNKRLQAASRAAGRGMTLIEIMIVVIIMAMIATGVSMTVIPKFNKAKISQARTDVCNIESAVNFYKVENQNKCPGSVQELIDDGQLKKNASTTDPWGNEFQIQCSKGEEAVVFSFGEDEESGSEDDIKCEQESREDK